MKRIVCLLCAGLLLLTACTVRPEDTISKTESEAVSSAETSEPEEKMEVRIGKSTYPLAAYNPTEFVQGVSIYDKASGLTVAEAQSGYTDLLVFDNMIADIRSGESTRAPFPNGYLIRMPDETAAQIKKGDAVRAYGIEVQVNPLYYVQFKDSIRIPIYYHNESRTGVARAVLYDGDYIHDSTDTNIWGMEIAVSAEGKVVRVVPSNQQDVSGNTAIPEGGFVLSTGNSTFCGMLAAVKEGDDAKVVKDFGLYDFYRLEELKRNYGDGEYLAMISEGFTKLDAQALNVSVASDGTVLSSSVGGGVKVPDGGFVLVATGIKRKELERFCKVGDKVFEKFSALNILTDANNSILAMQTLLTEYKQTAEEAKKRFLTVDHKTVDETIAAAEQALDDGSYALASDLLAALPGFLTPYHAVEERSAWLTDYDNDLADVKKTVAYAKSLGLNTLILSPFRSSLAMYETELPHLDRHPDMQIDLLQAYVDECHKEGIALIFMLCTFATEKPSIAYSEQHFVNYFSDKLLLSKRGRDVAYFYDSPSYTLNPFDPEVRQFFIDLLVEVNEKYDVDGIQLDYIRFPLPTYFSADRYEDFGYNEDIMQAFMKQEKTTDLPTTYAIAGDRWDRWCQFRCDIITSFVHEVKKAIGDTSLTCTCFADATDRRKYVFQDVAAWTDAIDAIYPMIYASTFEDEKKYADELYGIIGDSCHIVMGVGTYDGETDPIIRRQRLYATEFCDGISIFALTYTQTFGFDHTYREIFAKPAVRTDRGAQTAQAYLQWMLDEVVEKVYAYLADADLTALRQELETGIRAVQDSGDNYQKVTREAVDSLKAVAQTLPEELSADCTAKLDRLLTLLR